MTQSERKKLIATAVAELAGNALVPAAVRVGFAALAEEVAEMRSDVGALGAAFVSLADLVGELAKKLGKG